MFLGCLENEHDKLRAKFGRRWCRCCPWAPWPGPVGQAACLSETPVTFAGVGRASTETAIAFAGVGRTSTETAIAFAGEKWVFWCIFRAQRCRRFQRSLVGGEQWCWWFQRRRVIAPRARKSSPSVRKMAQNRRFYACWASFFAETRLEGRCWASSFADRQSWDPAGRVVLRRGPGGRPFDWQC